MAEPIVKRKQVTFHDGSHLPLGTRATFEHDGQTWIAYPATKNAAITTVMDRMLGVLSRISGDALRSIKGHPTNPELCAFASRVIDAEHRANDLATDKVKALTL